MSRIPARALAGLTASEVGVVLGIEAMLSAVGLDARVVGQALLAAQPEAPDRDSGCSPAAFAGTATQVGCSCLEKSRARCSSCSPLGCGCCGTAILSDGAGTISGLGNE